MKPMILISIPVILLAGAFACTSTHTNDAEDIDNSPVLATVGNYSITEASLAKELEAIPPYQRASFETPEGMRMLVDHIIERELLLQAAIDQGLDNDSFVVAQVELAMEQVEYTRDRAILQIYYQQQVVDAVVVPEEDVVEYYNLHINDLYHRDAQVKVSHILLEDMSDAAVVSNRLEDGIAFEELVEECSVHNPTMLNNGELGWVTDNSPIPYLGSQPELLALFFDSETDALIGPYETNLGVHFFKITDMQEEGAVPLDDVYESIENILKPTLINSYFQDTLLPELKSTYVVSINDDAFLPDADVPADSLLFSAQNMMEANPQSAIQYFELYLERFSENEKAHQAQFLIGFTYSEHLEDYENAEIAFQALLDNYPESDFADDALWMIENMRTPPEELIIPFEDSTISE